MEKILIVEDEARMRNIISDYFTAHGLECDLARDGEEALDLLRDNDYDAILLDIMMPKLDGFTVCREIRKTSSTPILFLTALGSEEDTLKGYALGCDDYVTKPFSLAVLLAKTRALMRRGGNASGVLTCGSISLDT
ncbi:MAG: response regulator, partial [Oscillospiraceae bacterium]|nr:response regulator [Oscillospiraceae bacterium]